MLMEKQETYREVLLVAENLYRQSPDWVTFFREIVGIDGIIRKRFPSFEELTKFEQSDEFDKIQKLLVKLRERRSSSDPETEPTRVITVRLPKSMHEYLRTEAHDLRTSMNKLCISKLLQVIGEEMIPNERTGTTTNQAGTASTSKPAPTNNHQGSLGGNNHHPTLHTHQPAMHTHQPTMQPPTQSPAPQPTSPPATMPFKPAQPRF